MTTTDAPLALGPPAWARAVAGLFIPAWAGVVLLTEVAEAVPILAYALPVLAALYLLWSSRVGVVTTADDHLVVRNLLGTLTVPRDHVGSVEIDEAGPSGRGWAIFVRTHEDLRFRLDATASPWRGHLERDAEALRAWRDGIPQAFL